MTGAGGVHRKSPRSKATRFLLIAVGVVACAAGAFVGLRAYRRAAMDRDATAARERGAAALTAGDYQSAIDGIGQYLQRFTDRGATAQDWVLYARAVREIEQPNGQHLAAAMAALRKALALDPADAVAQKDLLDLYQRTGLSTEALELIDKILERSPGDVDVRLNKLEVLARLRRLPEALEVARQINERAPDDFAGFFRTLYVLLEADASETDVAAWTDAVVASHPGDARFQLLRAAVAQRLHPGAPETSAILDKVIAGTVACSDEGFVRNLVLQLDVAGRFDDSLVVLERVQDKADVELRRELARRLFFAQRWNDVLTRVNGWGDAAERADPEFVALRVLALRRLGRAEDAEPPRKDIAGRADRVGKAWSALVERPTDGVEPNPRAAAEALRQAVRDVPIGAPLRHALGDVLAATGETDAAIESWATAAVQAPSWASPLRLIAQARLRTPGSERLAVDAARAAFARAPNDLETVGTLVDAIARNAQGAEPAQQDRLLKDIESIVARTPQAAPRLVVGRVEILLAKGDKARAESTLRDALADGTKSGETTLLRLALLARQADIPLEKAFLDLCESVHGVTPPSAFAQADFAARGGRVDDGLRVLDDLRKRAAPGTPDLAWDVVRATFLDAARRPEAGRAWIALADAHPDSVPAQLGALASSGAWSDRDAVARIIERMRKLTGDQAATWRVARARWLLASPTDEGESVAEAARTLGAVCRESPDAVSARVLFAQALERLGNLPGAEEQLRVAGNRAKNDAWISLELARIAQKQGHADEAKRRLDAALKSNDLAPAMTERLAYLLAAQGDAGRGAVLLEQLESRPGARRDGVLLLAKLYAKLGQTQRAIALCGKLLAEPDVETVQLAADLHASVGRKADAEAAIARLDGVELRPGERELVRARFASNWDAPDVAAARFASAVSAAPESADVWTAYLVFGVATSNATALNAVLGDARAARVDAVRFLREDRPFLDAVMSEPRLRPVLVEAVADKSSRDADVAALRLALRDWPNADKRVDVARAVGALADSNRRALQLQLLAADLFATVGDVERGSDIARRSMSQFADSALAASQAADFFARRGRWTEALDAGLAWRDRESPNIRLAELFVARAMVHVGRGADAAATLAPRVPSAMDGADANAELLLTYVTALVRCNRIADAADLVADLVRRSDRWRLLPMLITADWLGDAATASLWLRTCAGNVRESDVDARIQLARAWGAAWEQFKQPRLMAEARDAIARVTASPDAPAEAHVVAATLAQQAGDVDAAKKGYLAALAKDGTRVLARNNLAMLLADAGDWQGAADQATKACDAAPGDPRFLDTLAYALRKGREYAKAEACMRRAIDIEPANPEWHVGLAETLLDGGDAAGSKRLMPRIEELVAKRSAPSAALRRRMESLRDRQR